MVNVPVYTKDTTEPFVFQFDDGTPEHEQEAAIQQHFAGLKMRNTAMQTQDPRFAFGQYLAAVPGILQSRNQQAQPEPSAAVVSAQSAYGLTPGQITDTVQTLNQQDNMRADVRLKQQEQAAQRIAHLEDMHQQLDVLDREQKFNQRLRQMQHLDRMDEIAQTQRLKEQATAAAEANKVIKGRPGDRIIKGGKEIMAIPESPKYQKIGTQIVQIDDQGNATPIYDAPPPEPKPMTDKERIGLTSRLVGQMFSKEWDNEPVEVTDAIHKLVQDGDMSGLAALKPKDKHPFIADFKGVGQFVWNGESWERPTDAAGEDIVTTPTVPGGKTPKTLEERASADARNGITLGALTKTSSPKEISAYLSGTGRYTPEETSKIANAKKEEGGVWNWLFGSTPTSETPTGELPDSFTHNGVRYVNNGSSFVPEGQEKK